MGWLAAEAIAAILGAGASVYSAANPPAPPKTTQAVPAQGTAKQPNAESVFSVQTPKKQAQAPAAVTPPPNDPNLYSILDVGPPRPGQQPSGPPPAPAKLADLNYTPGPNADPYTQGPPNPATNGQHAQIMQILGAIPEALAAAGPLLGMFHDQQRSTHVIGAQGGGGGGQLVQGLNLPRRTSLADILAALPRPRYNA